MKYYLPHFAVFVGLPILLFAEINKVPTIPTRAEADAIIATEMQDRLSREADRKATIESVPAFEEWELDHGDRKTILRRVAPPPTPPQTREESEIEIPQTEQWTEEQIAAWVAEQPVHRTLNLTALVYDRSFTEITWREEESGEAWTVLSNIDFRYLSGIGSFEDEKHHWSTFLFVSEIDSEKEQETARRAAEEGFNYPPRTADRWLNILPADFLPTPPQDNSTTQLSPEYFIVSENEDASIPFALYEELDALHHYYHANEERLIAEYERRQVMNEARRAWQEANPPEPKDTVINFWRAE